MIIKKGAKIGKRCFIASGTIVPENEFLEDNGVYVGSPIRFLRKSVDSDFEIMNEMYQE